MSLLAWPGPDHLEQIDQQVEIAMVRTRMESKRWRQRRRFTEDLATHNMRWLMTDAQWTTFETFFSQSINNGQDWFTMDMRIGGLGGIRNYTCRFVCGGSQGPYTVKFQEPLWLVTAQVEVLGLPLMSETTLNGLL